MKIVIVENDNIWLQRTIKNINKILIKENINKKIITFNKYNQELKKSYMIIVKKYIS